MKNILVDDYGLTGWGISLIAVLLVALVTGLITSLVYKSACIEATVYNETNNTNWTCSDFFWAGRQINTQIQTFNVIQK